MSKEQEKSAYHLVVHSKVLWSSRPPFSRFQNLCVIIAIGFGVKIWVNELNLVDIEKDNWNRSSINCSLVHLEGQKRIPFYNVLLSILKLTSITLRQLFVLSALKERHQMILFQVAKEKNILRAPKQMIFFIGSKQMMQQSTHHKSISSHLL